MPKLDEIMQNAYEVERDRKEERDEIKSNDNDHRFGLTKEERCYFNKIEEDRDNEESNESCIEDSDRDGEEEK